MNTYRGSGKRSHGAPDKAAVRWFARYAADDRYLLLRDARELVDLLDGVGRHDQVAVRSP
jgi:hypothetical protein